jgi:glycosyltransferase involved in cell wall biosynthesis
MKERKIKVVHILEGFLGGTCTYVCTVLPQLVRKGFDVTLVVSLNRCCPDAQTRIAELKLSGVHVHVIPMCRKICLFRDIRSFIIILCLLSRNEFDIIHTHCSKAGALGRIAGFLIGVKVRLHTPHCFAFMRCNSRLKKLLYLFLEKALGNITTKLMTVSQAEAAAAIRHHIISSHRCVTVRNGLSIGQFYPNAALSAEKPATKTSLGLDNEAQVISTACRLVEYKGIFRLLKAASLCQTPNAVFLIAGDGELRSPVENFIKENRLNNKVRLLGHVLNIEQIYAVSDIVTLCSDVEAQPYSLLEAMRAKRPIVATSVMGNEELISNDQTGLLVNPSPVNIAEAVDGLLISRAKCNEYAENAYAYFCKQHTLKKQISEMTEVYRTLYEGLER